MFAYCMNNPVMGCDPCGTCIHNWKFYDCEKCAAFWNGVGQWFVDTYNTINSVYQHQTQLQTQVAMQQNKMIADAAEATWDAYMRGYNIQQEAQMMDAQLKADVVSSACNIIIETDAVDMGMNTYHTVRAARSFKKSLAYFVAPIPTPADEALAIGFALKGIYHLIRIDAEVAR